MARRNRHLLNLLNGFSDAALQFFSYFLAYHLRFYVFPERGGYQPFSNYWRLGLLSMAVTAGFYGLLHLYAPKRHSRAPKDLSIVVRANAMGVLFLGVVIYFWRFVDFSRWMLAFYFALSVVLVSGKHLFMRALLYRFRRENRNLRHVLLVGDGELAAQYCQSIAQNRQLGYTIVGYVSPCEQADSCALPNQKRLGCIAELNCIFEEFESDEVVIALDEEMAGYTKEAIASCNRSGQRFSIVPYYSAYVFSAAAPKVESIGTVQVYDICASPLDFTENRLMKRILDILIAGLVLILTSPLLLITAIGVKLTSEGPVLFRQERIGKKKEPFLMYKFRSMQVNARQDKAWSSKGDTRVTAFGRLIRKTSIDELPQMLNVLKGEMSMVGPRPEIPYHVNHFREEIPYYMARHQVKPGITGYAQINGYRGDTSIEGRISHDLYYIYNWSIFLDLEILLRTVFGGMVEK